MAPRHPRPTGRRPVVQEDLRRNNLAAVVRELHLSGALSRSELALRTGLNRSTVAGLVGDLAGRGLVRESTPGVSPSPAPRAGAGRPSLVVALDADRAWALAVEISPEAILAARVGLGGRVLARMQSPRPARPALTPDGAAAAIARLAGELSSQAGPGGPPDAVAVAVPGIVRRADGHVHLAPNLGWRDVPFGALVSAALGVPVELANEADLGVLAEHARGAAVGCADVIYVSGNTGVGAGILVDGAPLGGRSGYAGEVGHMKVNPEGRRCRCGGRGCWESEVGAAALLRRAGRRPASGRSGVETVLAAAHAGDAQAADAVADTARWMGRGVADLVNVFNPELVLFGGMLGRVFAQARRPVLAELRHHALPQAGGDVTVMQAGLGADSVLLGAAELGLAGVLADPLSVSARP